MRQVEPDPNPPLPPRKSMKTSTGQIDLTNSVSKSSSISRESDASQKQAYQPVLQLDNSGFDLVRAFNESFDRSRHSFSLASDSGADSSFDTAKEDSNAASSPLIPSISNSGEANSSTTDNIGWSASDISASKKQTDNEPHSRQTSDSFSFEATAQDEYAIRWANRDDRDSTSSVEYVEAADDDEERDSDYYGKKVNDDELTTPTLESTGGTITASEMRPPTTKSEQFPPRLQSYFPSRLSSVPSAAAGLNSGTNGLGVYGIAEKGFPDNQQQPSKEAPPKDDDSSELTPSATASTSIASADSPVYFPPPSPASSRGARSSIIPAAAVFPPPNSNTFYANTPIITQPSGPLITPENLPTISVQVTSSRMRNFHKVKGKVDDPIIILSIRDRSADKEWWKTSKTLTSLNALDSILRLELEEFSIPRIPDRAQFVSLAPSKVDSRKRLLEGYFSAITSIPSLSTEAAILFCDFLSRDILDPMALHDSAVRKEGYLTKRGKNFGGWKARYFVLDGPELQYFDAPGGSLLGSIRIDNSEIYKQEAPGGYDDAPNAGDRAYRHALQISERKRADSSSSVRHILCAESDEDRDDWVDALKEFTGTSGSSSPTPSLSTQLLTTSGLRASSDQRSIMSSSTSMLTDVASSASSAITSVSPKKKLSTGISIASPISRKLRIRKTSPVDSSLRELSPTAVPASAVLEHTESNGSSASLTDGSALESGASTPSAHMRTQRSPVLPPDHHLLHPDDGASITAADLKKQKKRSIFSLRKETSHESGLTVQAMSTSEQYRQQQQHDTRRFLQLDMDSLKNNPMYEYRASLSRQFDDEPLRSPNGDRLDYDNDPKFKGEIVCGGLKAIDKTISVSVFGIPLSQAIEVSFVQKGEVKVPSVLYRCVEYLDYKHANREEGIFRLSGSSSVIRALKERFNTGEFSHFRLFY